MPLKEEQKEILRNSILLALMARHPLSLSLESILIAVKCNGFQTLDTVELEKQLRYLFAHQRIEPEDREMNKANVRYLITRAGISWLDEQGLV